MTTKPNLHAAVVLSGSGVFDGSEIHEAVAVLYHLSRLGAGVQCFAPDADQPEVVNHLTGKPTHGEKRNMLVEAARIARGRIRPLHELRENDFDALFFPGGSGAAKNLSDYATAGAACSVNPEVRRVIQEFHGAGKPIGLCCIAPVLAARVLGNSDAARSDARAVEGEVRVTLGDDESTAQAVRAMGAIPVAMPSATQAYSDTRNHIVTTPAYMHDAPIHEIFEGIGRMVERTLSMSLATEAGTVSH